MNLSTSPVEAPLTLEMSSDPGRSLGVRDQLTLWASLGVSLLIPATAVFVVQPRADLPPLTTTAALVAVLAGTAVGSWLLAGVASISTVHGTPAMATLRALLGRRGSLVPTALNIVQCCGWAALEVYVIAQVATAFTDGRGRIWWTLTAGALATAMAVRPLRSVRVIRKYLMWLVVAASGYLLWHVVSAMWHHPSAPGPTRSWDAVWLAFDIVVTMPVSWAVLAGDWTRHSRRRRDTVVGVSIGYGASCVVFFLIGVLAVSNSTALAAQYSPSAFVDGLLALPVGALALAVLAVDEIDEAFANIYSTAMSTQNLAARVDRRWLVLAVGVLATALAATVNLEGYESFLLLIGAVFLPLVAVLLTDWFIVRRVRNGRAGAGFSPAAPDAPVVVYAGAWLLGACVYSTISPAGVPAWSAFWTTIGTKVPWLAHLTPSATLTTLVVTAAVTAVGGIAVRR